MDSVVGRPQIDVLQANVELARAGTTALASARAVFAELEEVCDDASEGLAWFWFMRKPPDLRLRFGVSGSSVDVSASVAKTLDRLCCEGPVARWWVSPYVAEVDKFGGADAMEAVHRHFDRDTRAWLAFDRLAAGAAALTPLRVVVAAADDLFWRGLGDPDGVAQAWATLHALGGYDRPPPARGGRGLETLPPFSPQEQRITDMHRSANEELLLALRRLAGSKRLEGSVDAVLPFVAHFTAHRWGLDGVARAELADATLRSRMPAGM